MKQLLVEIIRRVGKLALIFWVFLTLIVILFLVTDKPNTKGISQRDLLDYRTISIWFVSIFIASKIFYWFYVRVSKTNLSHKRKNSN